MIDKSKFETLYKNKKESPKENSLLFCFRVN